jgi:3-hydroxyisobutyrate dehydrogenase-like beta-hydroxyacid dehydrogenase
LGALKEAEVQERSIAIIGFGEVGGILARDLRAAGVARIAAFDIAFADPESRQSRAAREGGAAPCGNAAEAAAGTDVVISAVTAGAALDAARAAAPGLAHGPFFLDVNSVSPGTKREAASVVEAAGGRYVEAAVMTSVPPHGIRSPMLLGGPHATDFVARAAPFGMRLTALSPEIGAASSVKMCRSVLIKGMEALATECLLAARHYGVERQVLASLADTLPHEDWRRLARWMISRPLVHGRRRAEEMREVARTVREAGIEPVLSAPTAVRQDWSSERGRELPPEVLADGDLEAVLDAILALPALNAAGSGKE